MTSEVLIGSESVKMCGNAATAIRFKSVFHRDLLMSFSQMTENNLDADIVKELGFVMYLQAQGRDFNQVTFNDYCSWLEQFEEQDFLQALPSIINLWMSTTKLDAKAKKK